MIDALIVIDNMYREYLNLNLLRRVILRKKISSRIISKHLYEDAIIKYKPSLVIIPRLTPGFNKIFMLSKKMNFKIYLLPCEHGAANKERIISFLVGNDKKDNFDIDDFGNYKSIEKIFVPSESYKTICLETKLFNEEQLTVTGTLSSDFWFQQISNTIEIKKKNKTIGIATSFKSTFFGIHFHSFLDGLYLTKRISDSVQFKNSIENKLSFHTFESLSFLNLIKIVEENPDVNFSWRLHPQENIKGAKMLAKKIPNLEINRDIYPHKWIKDQSLILLFTSTMIYDSYFLNTPTISLINLIPKKIIESLEETKKPLATNQIYSPNTLEEVITIIKEKKFEKNYLVQKDEMISESRKNFNFPRDKFASISILDEIEKVKVTNKNNFIFKNMLIFLIDLLVGLKTMKAAYRLNLRDNQLDKLLNPARIEDKFKVNHFINKIIDKIV